MYDGLIEVSNRSCGHVQEICISVWKDTLVLMLVSGLQQSTTERRGGYQPYAQSNISSPWRTGGEEPLSHH